MSGLRQRLRAGDPEAFAELYDELAARVVNHAHRLTGDWALAEDVMSETFLVAWRSRAALDPDGESVAGWLLAIATNQALKRRPGGPAAPGVPGEPGGAPSGRGLRRAPGRSPRRRPASAAGA